MFSYFTKIFTFSLLLWRIQYSDELSAIHKSLIKKTNHNGKANVRGSRMLMGGKSLYSEQSYSDLGVDLEDSSDEKDMSTNEHFKKILQDKNIQKRLNTLNCCDSSDATQISTLNDENISEITSNSFQSSDMLEKFLETYKFYDSNKKHTNKASYNDSVFSFISDMHSEYMKTGSYPQNEAFHEVVKYNGKNGRNHRSKLRRLISDLDLKFEVEMMRAKRLDSSQHSLSKSKSISSFISFYASKYRVATPFAVTMASIFTFLSFGMVVPATISTAIAIAMFSGYEMKINKLRRMNAVYKLFIANNKHMKYL
ncbi:Pv-fam-d protein [Plasmodium gonderi]|uniref:Pv-fam-d protein n=1 Tax=Plasmodium gonderi TaxID=77519 RepID=A0A1Y1JVB4_PLAGO|nr:Pv-fam-d protein [Plasmodium gonderi]GAW84682.1 Pv-fam-d protein [Plasmodium gonderi]